MDFILYADSTVSLAKVISYSEGRQSWVIWRDDGRGRSIKIVIDLFCGEPETFHEALPGWYF